MVLHKFKFSQSLVRQAPIAMNQSFKIMVASKAAILKMHPSYYEIVCPKHIEECTDSERLELYHKNQLLANVFFSEEKPEKDIQLNLTQL